MDSIEQHCDTYLEYKALSPYTIEHYQKIVRLFCRENKVKHVNEVTSTLLLAWRRRVLERASAAAWNNYHRHLRALFNFLVEQGVIDGNPFSEVGQVRQYRRLPKTVSLDMIHIALGQLRQNPDRFKPAWFWQTLIEFLYYHGVRRKQMVDLRWRDIDLAGGRLMIRNSKARQEQVKPLHPAAIPGLKDLRARTEEALGRRATPGAQVFNVTLFYARYKGARMNVDQVSGFFRRFGMCLEKETGCARRLSAHKLRHTIATLLSETGRMRALQELLGHADLATTGIYIHPDMQALSELIEHLPVLRADRSRSRG